MNFSIAQNVAVAPDAAVAAYASPAFYEDREPSGDISLVEVVSHEDTGSQASIDVRYRFTGSVSSAVRAVVDPTKMSWVTHTAVDKSQRRTSFTVLPDFYPDRLECSGTFRFDEGAGPDSTVITIAGDLTVHVFLVGRTVEQLIVTGLRKYLEAELLTLPDFTRRA
jgi:hypothetical protein